MSERVRSFGKDEIIAFLEELMLNDQATYEQEELYLNYTWNGKLSKKNQTCLKTKRQMKRIYNGF